MISGTEELVESKGVYTNAFYAGLKPDKVLTVSEWADKYRYLPSMSAEPGRWRTQRTPYLKEIMDCLSDHSPYQEIVFMKSAQVGGANCLKTSIPTPTGWTTMGELKVGDKLFDENGKVCKVKWKSKIFTDNQCYKITFSDKSEIVCDHLHKWKVYDHRMKNKKMKVLGTPEMYESFKFRDGARCTYATQVTKPLNLRKKKIPINPYLLGVWLGDGSSHNGYLYLFKEDETEIMGKIQLKHSSKMDSENCVKVTIPGFLKQLKEAGLVCNKHIPNSYLRAHENYRWEILRGLMDSDGNITKGGRAEFSSRKREVFESTYELLMTLGFKVSVYHSVTTRGFRGKEIEPRDQWRISFTPFNCKLFNLERKQKRVQTSGRIIETKKRYITNIERVKTVPTACIEVDSPSHLYLCGKSMIPTHNTECGLNWVGYSIDHSPCVMMIIQPTADLSKRNSKQKITPMIESSPTIVSKVKAARERDSGNTILQKDFTGGTLILASANTAVSLRSTSAQRVMADECEAYPPDVDGEGDPVKLAAKRQITFGAKKKLFLNSTPLVAATSIIEPAYEKSDKRRYHVPCPGCNFYQHLRFASLKFTKNNKRVIDVHYTCENCGLLIEEFNKTKMLDRGKWVKENPESPIAGFHINALYSPLGWLSWREICQEFIDAKDNPELLKSFVNTVLGETWKEKGEAPDWERLYERRTDRPLNVIPEGGLMLVAGCDVQKDRLEVEITVYGRQLRSWSIDYRVFYGDTAKDDVWRNLDALMVEEFPLQDSKHTIRIKGLAIDSGYNTQRVYQYVRTQNQQRVFATKGQDTLPQMIGAAKKVDVSTKGKVLRRGVNLWKIGTHVAKSELYGFLRQSKGKDGESDPIGYCDFPMYNEDYFKQLTAEELLIKKVRGYNKPEWTKIRERNEILDCKVLGRAATIILGYDRFQEKHFRKLEKERPRLHTKKDEPKPAPQKEEKKVKRKKSSWL